MYFLYLLIFATNADLISWNRSWNSIYRYSKGQQLLAKQSIENPMNLSEYRRQLNSYLHRNHYSEKPLLVDQLFGKKNGEVKTRATNLRTNERKTVSRNRYDGVENFKDHFLRFQLP